MSKAGRNWTLGKEGKENLRDLKPPQKLTMIVLGDIHNERTGRCFPSLREVCERTGYGLRQQKAILKSLEEEKILRVIPREGYRGRTTSNEYFLPYMGDFEVEKISTQSGKDFPLPPAKISTQVEKISTEVEKIAGANMNTTVNSKKENNNQPTNFFDKQKLQEGIKPVEKTKSPPVSLSIPDYETRCRWARGEWTEHEANGEYGEGGKLHAYYKQHARKDRENVPDWLRAYHDYNTALPAELIKQYNL
jgi:hypothetical protein